MSEAYGISLDNPILHGRLRAHPGRIQTRPSARYFNDVFIARPNAPTAKVRPQNATNLAPKSPAMVGTSIDGFISPTRPIASHVNSQELPLQPEPQLASQPVAKPRGRQRFFKSQLVLTSMAIVVFALGIAVSIQTFWTNHTDGNKIQALSSQASRQANPVVPGTAKPTTSGISQYIVAPDMARYIKIPKLDVYARVRQVGVTASGALGVPSNVYDAAWYSGSSKPGQPGAMLLDGHVSSWTTNGVFYGLKNLEAGDNIQIVRGDGVVFNYQVVKSQTYSADNVDMQAAVTPVTAGKPGLNLITCTGKVKPGTSDFTNRLIVFAQQI